MQTIRAFVMRAAWIAAMGAAAAIPARAADNETPVQREAKLIAILQSDAPPQDKAIPCKQLALCGSAKAVPALAALLPDPELSSWARIALEAIPDPAADAALREAMGKLKGRLLIGVINSIGVRRDAQAVNALTTYLADSDADVASSAAAALGRIGGDAALAALTKGLSAAPPGVRLALAEGCVLHAERLQAEGKADQALALFDTVRKADVPQLAVIEATRGAVLARKAAGVPMLVELLNSKDKAMYRLGLRLARELEGREATDAMAGELAKASADAQVKLLTALKDRGDASAAAAVRKYAASEDAEVRIAAYSALGALGDASCVEVLLGGACGSADEAPTAREALKQLGGADVDAALVAQVRSGPPARQAEVIGALSTRGAVAGVPAFLTAMESPEAAVRQNAVTALRQLAGMTEMPTLLERLTKSDSAETRRGIQSVVVAVVRRSAEQDKCAEMLMAAWKQSSGAVRTDVLEIIGRLGLPQTLAAVEQGLKAADVDTRKSVLLALSNWPDSRIVPALMELARNDRDAAVRTLAIRIATPRVGSDDQATPPQKAARFAELMKLVGQADGRKQVLAELKSAPCAESLALAVKALDDGDIVNEAALAIAEIATAKGRKVPLRDLEAALKKAGDAKILPAVRQRIQAALKAIQPKTK